MSASDLIVMQHQKRNMYVHGQFFSQTGMEQTVPETAFVFGYRQ